jgi:hypothetical protein
MRWLIIRDIVLKRKRWVIALSYLGKTSHNVLPLYPPPKGEVTQNQTFIKKYLYVLLITLPVEKVPNHKRKTPIDSASPFGGGQGEDSHNQLSIKNNDYILLTIVSSRNSSQS